MDNVIQMQMNRAKNFQTIWNFAYSFEFVIDLKTKSTSKMNEFKVSLKEWISWKLGPDVVWFKIPSLSSWVKRNEREREEKTRN